MIFEGECVFMRAGVMRRCFIYALSAVLFAGGMVAAPSAAVAIESGDADAGQYIDSGVTYTLHKADNPSADQIDAYSRIDKAMSQAAAIWNVRAPYRFHVDVYYKTGTPTAEGGPSSVTSGTINFGSNRSYMVTGTALHEIAHCMGVGYYDYGTKIKNGEAKRAVHALQKYDGAGAKLNYGGSHIWPYGLNYASEWAKNPQRTYEGNVDIVASLRLDIIGGSSVGGISKGLSFVTPDVLSIDVGKDSSIDIDTNQDFASTFEISSGVLPDGLTIDRCTGRITGKVSKSGSYSFVVDAYNGVEHKEKEFALVVRSVPSIVTSSLPVATVGDRYETAIETSGFPAPIVSVTGLPDGLMYDVTSGLIIGAPTVDGTFDVVIKASSEAGETIQKFALTVVKRQTVQPSGGDSNGSSSNLSSGPSVTQTSQQKPLNAADSVSVKRGVEKDGELPQTGVSVILPIVAVFVAVAAVVLIVARRRR